MAFFLMFLAYTSAEDVRVESSNKGKIESIKENSKKQEENKVENKNWVEKLQEKIFPSKSSADKKQTETTNKEENKTQKTWTVVSCDQKSWFAEKINQIKIDSIEKVNTLEKINISLQGIIPLVKNSSIRTNLEKQKKTIQIMKKNYSALNSNILKNPKIVCGENFLWKTYNEETKIMIENIRKQFLLLKK